MRQTFSQSFKEDAPYWAILTLPATLWFCSYLVFGTGEIGLGFHANYPFYNDAFRFVMSKVEIIERIYRLGEFPFWNPYQGYGIDLWAALSKDPFLTLALRWLDHLTGVVLVGCLHLILGQLFFYTFGKNLGLSRKGACLGGVAYGWCGYFATYLYDMSIVGTSIWCVGILASYLGWRKRQRLTPLVWGAVCTAIAISYGRPTDIAYFLLFFLVWQIQDALTAPILPNKFADFTRTSLTMLAMGVTGLMLSLPIMLPFFMFVLEGSRDLAVAAAEKTEYMRFDHFHGLFIPTLQTGATRFIALAALPLWLTTLLQKKPSPKVRLFGWTALLVLLLQPPLGLFDLIRSIPSQEATWTPSRFMAIGLICICSLIGTGYDTFFANGTLSESTRKILKRALTFFTILGGIFLITVIVTAQTHWGIWELVGVKTRDLNTRLGWGTWAMLGLTLSAWFMVLKSPHRAFTYFLIAILPATYLVTQSGNPMKGSNARLARHAEVIDSDTFKRLQKGSDKHEYRVHVLGPSLYAMRTIISGKGLDIDYSYEAAEPAGPYKMRFLLWHQGKYYRNWFNVGNIRYLMGQESRIDPYVRETYPVAWEEKDADLVVFENPDVWPRVFLTSRVVEEPNLDHQMLALSEPGVVEPLTAMVEDKNGISISPGAGGTADITEYSANRVVIDCDSTGDSMLVFSDRISPGWTATLDGREVPIIRTNFMFRGIAIPTGRHTVEFSFRPPGFDLGCKVSMIAALFLVACLLFDRFRGRKADAHGA